MVIPFIGLPLEGRKSFFFGSHDESIYLLETFPELSHSLRSLYPDQIIIYPEKVLTSVKPFELRKNEKSIEMKMKMSKYVKGKRGIN